MIYFRRPRSNRAASLAIACLLFCELGCNDSPQSVWTEARTAFEARDYARAERAMTRLGTLRTPTVEDSMMTAQLAMVRKQVDEALIHLALVPDDHPMGASARLQAGQLELRRNRVRYAARHFRDAIRIEPKLAQAHRELIYIYGMQLRRPELYREFRALAEIEALRADQVFLWCLTRGTVWEPVEVSEVMARYIAADPEDRESRLALVESLRKLSRFDEAEKALSPLSNDDPEARALRAQLALDRGDDALAETLLADGPRSNLELALLRGRLALARGRTEAAVSAYRDAVQVEPNHRDAVFGLAHALQKVGHPDAKRYLKESLHLERLSTLVQRAAVPSSRDDPQLIRDLGAACADAGRLPEARAWYTVAIKLNPLDTEAQQALFNLKDAKVPES